jgi:hypothetical protein
MEITRLESETLEEHTQRKKEEDRKKRKQRVVVGWQWVVCFAIFV